MPAHNLTCRFLLALPALLLIGCSTTEHAATHQARKQVYIDANLLVEICYPEEWSKAM